MRVGNSASLAPPCSSYISPLAGSLTAVVISSFLRSTSRASNSGFPSYRYVSALGLLILFRRHIITTILISATKPSATPVPILAFALVPRPADGATCVLDGDRAAVEVEVESVVVETADESGTPIVAASVNFCTALFGQQLAASSARQHHVPSVQF